MKRKLSLLLSLFVMVLLGTVSMTAHATEDEPDLTIVDPENHSFTISILSPKSGNCPVEIIPDVFSVTGNNQINLRVAKKDNEKDIINVVEASFNFSKGSQFDENTVLEDEQLFEPGESYTCKMIADAFTYDYNNGEKYYWDELTAIFRSGDGYLSLEPVNLTKIEGTSSFEYFFNFTLPYDYGSYTLDLGKGDVKLSGLGTSPNSFKITTTLFTLAVMNKIIMTQERGNTSPDINSVTLVDLDMDNNEDFSYTHYTDGNFVFRRLDSCNIDKFTLTLSNDEKKLLDEKNLQYFSEIKFILSEDNHTSIFNLGPKTLDFNNGSIYIEDFNSLDATAITNALAVARGDIHPNFEKLIFCEHKKYQNGTYRSCNLNANDDGFDFYYIIVLAGVEFGELDSRDCDEKFVLNLNKQATNYLEEHSCYYYNPITFVFSKKGPVDPDNPEENKNNEQTGKTEENKTVESAAETEVTIDNATYKIDGENATLVSASNVKGKFSVPASVTIGGKDYIVTKIADSAFAGSGITSITIGNNVTEIGDNAFAKCKKLTTVTIGKNVTKIGKMAFYKCPKLKKIIFKGKNVKSIGSKAFKKIKKKAYFKVSKKYIANYTKLLKGKRDSGSKIGK